MTLRITAATAAGIAAAAAASLMALTACSSGASSSGATTSSSHKKACVMLPDAESANRWVNGDQPVLQKDFAKAGFSSNIQNAQNDTGKFATLAQQQLTAGCSVMVLTDLNGAGIQVTQEAHKQGVPVIAYDRPIQGADYYVSFNNYHVGQLEGQIVVDGLKAEGKNPATAKVVYLGGDPTDGNAKQFHDGADSVMRAAGIKPAFSTPGTWDVAKAGTYFEQAYTALHGNVDAVWSANDINAGAAIQVLDKNGKKVPVSGQDASPVGLQNILLGKQTATVYKPFQLEAQATVNLVIQLASGHKPVTSLKAPDGTPFIAETPLVVDAKNMETVFTDGNAKVTAVCTGPVAALCTKDNIH